MMRRMAQADQNSFDLQPFRELGCACMQDNERFSTGFSTDLDVFPIKLSGKSDSESFRDSLFCREPGGEMWPWIAHRTTIVCFGGLIDLFDETVPVAQNCIRNSACLYHVNPDAENHPRISSSMSRTAFSKP